MRLSYWLDSSWRVQVLILAGSLLTGLITYAATTPQSACHLAPAAAPGRVHLMRVCP